MARPDEQSGFDTFDGARLFYRVWQPLARATPRRVLVFLHRGHEHSGRIAPLVERLAGPNDQVFAWDARGHGHSPGERGDAPGFEALVRDFDTFMQHLHATHRVAIDEVFIVANSVGAVIAATWLHDYARRVRGVAMIAAAFDINLYVPLAKPALRLARRFKPELFVTSYIRSSMLTHSATQAAAYDADPLITKNISARVLLDLADTAKRIVADAQAISTPILMLVASKDYVVKPGAQRAFFERLASPLKHLEVIPNSHHAILYEDAEQTNAADAAIRRFIDACEAHPTQRDADHLAADTDSASARQYLALREGRPSLFFMLQKKMLGVMGPLSEGMRIGLTHGFDSGASLDHVYRNQAQGRWLIGKSIDRGYLDAIGWRGIRVRKAQLQQSLASLISAHAQARPLRILDVATGGGRYLLETLKRFQNTPIEATLRDFDAANLDQARALAQRLELNNALTFQQRDAFEPASYSPDDGLFDIVIVSGLYELFAANAPVLQSLRGIASVTRAGGHLLYTGQPWHPQLQMIAQTLTNHRGQPWVMRPRPQAEMDALVGAAGFRKTESQIGVAGIFTVSVAQRQGPSATPRATD